jgi:murein DD-endopeptidase MepM/ murein hydrolase activator NlpD
VKRSTRHVAALVTAFLSGAAVDSWLRVYGPPQPVAAGGETEAERTIPPHEPAAPRAPEDAAEATPAATTGRARPRVPIDGFDPDAMKGGFNEERAGHQHEAVDLLAPRNTPVHAVEDGTIAKLFLSKAGGITIYQFDTSGRLCFYYAHLERYADGLKEGQTVRQGGIIGYVGTSGNAPPGTPHLHFAVFEVGPDRAWWKGKAIDPYLVFR